MIVKHTSDIAAHLRRYADAVEAMDAELPAGFCKASVNITMFRRSNDGHTNGTAMGFVDRMAVALGIPDPQADHNDYSAGDSLDDHVCLFPLKPKLVEPAPPFDPDL